MLKALYQFLPFVARYKVWAISVVVFVVLQSAVARWLPIIVGKVIDQGIAAGNLNYIKKWALIYLFIQAVSSTLLYIQTISFQKLGNKILFDIREKLLSHVQNLPTTYFDKNPTGRIVTRVTNDVSSLGAFFNQVLFSLFTSFVEFFAIIIAMAFISLKLSLVCLVFSPLVAFITIKLTRKIKIIIEQQKSKLASINAFVAENINGMSLLQLYNRVPANLSKFKANSREYKEISLKMTHNYALLWPLMHFYTALAVLISIFYGTHLKTTQSLQIGLLVAFFLYVQDIHHPLTNFLEKYVQLQDSLTSAERIFTLMAEKTELRSNYLPPPKIRGHVVIKDLSFRYNSNSRWVLENLNLEIKPGESLGIVGKTGSGKSSLISLLQRFYDFESGQIIVDGQDIRGFSSELWRKHIGVVQQDPFIFKGTIASNINLNCSAITRKHIEESAQLAQCFGLFQSRIGGLDCPVEEKGANLSLGERQLIAFARVLAFDPDILILDEATANIDSHTEFLIQKAIQKVTESRTSIIVAHRLSTLQDCHRIAVIENHKIIELGSHQELMNSKGHYYHLHTKHFNPSSQKDLLIT
ncbi:MAG: ABC transporter ATP-binding protein [Pseudomonadota bacterium]|nr:ABC transporter ATP-binding protein [Pseudomonadota bacterium]